MTTPTAPTTSKYGSLGGETLPHAKRTNDQITLEKQRKKFNAVRYDLLQEQSFVTEKYKRQREEMIFATYTAALAYTSRECYHPEFDDLVADVADDGAEQSARESAQERGERTSSSTTDDKEEGREFLRRALHEIANTYPPSLRPLESMLSRCADDDALVTREKHGGIVHRFLCFTLNFHNIFVYPRHLNRDAWMYQVICMEDEDDNTPKKKIRTEDANRQGPNTEPCAAIVFHGSRKHRLYSLMRNGALTLNTVSHGRTYGDGFYCSADFRVAAQYSDGFVCAYVLRRPLYFQKKTSVFSSLFVVDDSAALTLAYVLPKDVDPSVVEIVKQEIWSTCRKPGDPDNAPVALSSAALSSAALSSAALSSAAPALSSPAPPLSTLRSETPQTHRAGGEGNVESGGGVVSGVVNVSRRIVQEIQRTFAYLPQDRVHEHGIEIEIDENDCKIWTVRFRAGSFPSETMLHQDMISTGTPHVALRVHLPHDFPFDPPFMWVVYPRFELRTGHVTQGGALCAEFLTNTGSASSWSSMLSMGATIVMAHELVSRDGRLDRLSPVRGGAAAYNEQEARSSFVNTLKTHGWRK